MTLLYIDPGAGSLLIQALIAAIVAVPFFFRNSIRSFVGRFRRHQVDPTSEPLPDKHAD